MADTPSPDDEPARYVHQPLDNTKQQLRLIKIRDESNGHVSCDVSVFDIDEAPPYSALSYTWGPPSPVVSIFLNSARFEVRMNLFCFLEAFRLEPSEYLWIDQICIDQSNTLERNHQVGLMSKIYSRCQSTIIWLCDKQGLYPSFARDFNRDGRKISLIPLVKDVYFTRLWIVQEVLLSPNVRVLTKENVWIPWKSIENCFKEKAWESGTYGTVKALVMPHYRRSGACRALSWSIESFSGNKCEDPRDKVYGLLGLINGQAGITVDYSKSAFEVFVDAVTAVPINARDRIAGILGLQMGIDTTLVHRLRAFLALITPYSICHLVQAGISNRFVTAIGVLQEPRNIMRELLFSEEKQLADMDNTNNYPEVGRYQEGFSAPIKKAWLHKCPCLRFRDCKHHDQSLHPYSSRELHRLTTVPKWDTVQAIHDYCLGYNSGGLLKRKAEQAWEAFVKEVKCLHSESTMRFMHSVPENPYMEPSRLIQGGAADLLVDTLRRIHRSERTTQNTISRADAILDNSPDSRVSTSFYVLGGNVYRFLSPPDWDAIFKLHPLIMADIIAKCRRTLQREEDENGDAVGQGKGKGGEYEAVTSMASRFASAVWKLWAG